MSNLGVASAYPSLSFRILLRSSISLESLSLCKLTITGCYLPLAHFCCSLPRTSLFMSLLAYSLLVLVPHWYSASMLWGTEEFQKSALVVLVVEKLQRGADQSAEDLAFLGVLPGRV